MVRDATQPANRPQRRGIVLTTLGTISTIVFTVIWVLDGGLAAGLLALVSTLTLIAGIILLQLPQIVDDG